jgi:hypothetical protein
MGSLGLIGLFGLGAAFLLPRQEQTAHALA